MVNKIVDYKIYCATLFNKVMTHRMNKHTISIAYSPRDNKITNTISPNYLDPIYKNVKINVSVDPNLKVNKLNIVA